MISTDCKDNLIFKSILRKNIALKNESRSSPFILASSFRLLPLSIKAKFFLDYSKTELYKPISNIIQSAGEIYIEFTTNENVNFENLILNINILSHVRNISEADKNLLTNIREKTIFIPQLKKFRENLYMLERSTLLTSFGEYESRRRPMISAIRTIKNSCEWGISGLKSDEDILVESINNTIEEIHRFEKLNTLSKSFKDIDFQKKHNTDNEIFRYISGRPNEGATKIHIGSEEIISVINGYSYYVSENGKKYLFDLIKTRAENGHKRYIFKIGEVYVAGIMITENNQVIASYIESFLNEKETKDLLFSAIKNDIGKFDMTIST
ncbi:hypothetical protein METP3_01330 [Methanosarcinales archaeon]|nr:hypothetical protein METP3_01330 [Methanosarcinales archaeon]